MEAIVCNGAVMVKPTLLERIARRLFPAKHCDVPEAPAEYQDVLHMRIVVELSFADRMRILAGGDVVVLSKTVTEFRIGRSVTVSESFVQRPMTKGGNYV